MRDRDYLSRSLLWAGLVFIGAGLAAGAAGLAFERGAERLGARVVGLETVRYAIALQVADKGRGVLYYPVVEYAASDGVSRTFVGRTGRTNPEHSVGKAVTVLVSRTDADAARLDTYMGVWGSATILGAVGLAFLSVSFVTLIGFRGPGSAREEDGV